MKHADHMAEFLSDEVNLNPTRLETLQRNVGAIATHLSTSATVGHMYVDCSIQGSWAQKTIIKPKAGHGFDADILVRFDNIDDLSPAGLIDAVYEALRESAVYAPKTSRKDRCVRVDYAGEHHVDVVPFVAYGVGPAGHIANRATDRWEATDPLAYREWFANTNRSSNGELRRVLRLLKYLRDIKGTFSVKSVILTVLVADQVEGIGAFADTPTALRDLLNALADHLDTHPASPPDVQDPSNPGATLNHRWNTDSYPNFRERIRYYADKVDAAYRTIDRNESMRLWREVFPEFGTEPDRARSEPTAADEQTLLGAHRIPTVLNPGAIATITCTADGRRIDTQVALHKDRKLRFEVTTNVAEPLTVFWKIKNTGKDARSDDCLRGEVVKGEGYVHEEPTKYVGKHWVEAYIVKDGACVTTARKNLVFSRLPR